MHGLRAGQEGGVMASGNLVNPLESRSVGSRLARRRNHVGQLRIGEYNVWSCSAPCLNAGSCIVTSESTSSYSCVCLHGFTGLNCELEVDLCASVPCRNGGRCVQTGPGHFRCECRVGYRGMTCETDIDECLSSAHVSTEVHAPRGYQEPMYVFVNMDIQVHLQRTFYLFTF
ncbi:hypothetical protein Btru_029975 [Bulinus truncatus]|nr:hypothetical protein Btru_029975 [Bulinus truncatus]